ncbi:MAG: class II fructose-1,6-bisphosphate aldolase [Tepidanaerobacter acetatoxydans]|uniref:class II fructose-1,6-bisphosphate aldolase n=1 Tax=Tepidanaerobacter TaxID=499228 RepID=UPI000A58FBC7|nr:MULTISPECIES: class II fructose-1,6-bisphosphate aldolase [Tepidanaerobacter]NLU10985.1 class II fructose-1,6-bisphosphate aldolase [Tepidanaerobacter acetatoxydans]
MLVSSKEMLQKAQQNKYAIAAFNIHNLETLKAVVETAEAEQSPLILQTTPGTCEYAGIDYLVAMAETASKAANIPIALHLDHGNSADLAIKCIDIGYTSVMIDGSMLPFEENVSLVKQVVEYAHKKHVQVEAELGHISGVEENISSSTELLTDPMEAEEFVKRTGVDSLAIAVGTAHGIYKGTPKIHFDIIRNIRKVVSIPLVLHGCSGVPEVDIKQAVECGICKINIATDIKIAFAAKLKESFSLKPDETDPRKYFKPAIESVKEVVKSKIYIAGSYNKA